MKNMSLLMLTLIMIVTGCSYFYDLYPAKLSTDALDYIAKDSFTVGWPCVGKAKDLREAVITKHTISQAEINYELTKDNSLFARATDQATINLQIAEAERQKLIGTVEQPGYLLGVLLPLIGGIAGRFITTLTHYSEAELQVEVAKVKNGANQTTPITAAAVPTTVNNPAV